MTDSNLQIRIKRIYAEPEAADGRRILVDALWARGMSKARAQIHFWARNVAPSTELRRWYGHDPDKWEAFRERYAEELDANRDAVQTLLAEAGDGVVTFLFSSKEEQLNNAAALKLYIESKWGTV